MAMQVLKVSVFEIQEVKVGEDIYRLVEDLVVGRFNVLKNGCMVFSDIRLDVCKVWAKDDGKLKQHPGWSVAFR